MVTCAGWQLFSPLDAKQEILLPSVLVKLFKPATRQIAEAEHKCYQYASDLLTTHSTV